MPLLGVKLHDEIFSSGKLNEKQMETKKMTAIPERYLMSFKSILLYCFGNYMCSVNLRYWQNISFITERSHDRTRMLQVILGGRVVMNLHIKLCQCGNCCITTYLIILRKKKMNNHSFVWLMSQIQKKDALSLLGLRFLTNVVGYIPARRTSHNHVLMDFSPSKGNLNIIYGIFAWMHKLTVIIGISMLDVTRGWKNKL